MGHGCRWVTRAGVSEKALRRRIERGTVDSEVSAGRRLVRVESVVDDPAPRARGVNVAPLLASRAGG